MEQKCAHQGNHPPFRVKSLKLIQRGSVVAFAEIDTGCGIVIRDFVLMDEPGQAMRVAAPTMQTFDRAGRKFYSKLCEIEPAVKKLIDDAIFAAYRDALAVASLETEVGHA